MKDTNLVKVLVIDDSSTNNLLFQSILEDEGYQVLSASDGKDGLITAEKYHPDLILLDIMMPKMDGIDVLKNLSENVYLKDIPVLIISAKNDAATIKKAKQMGALDYIIKPVSILDVMERIHSCLRGKK